MNEWVFTNDGTKEIKWVKKVLGRNEKSHFKINIKRKKNERKTVDYDKKNWRKIKMNEFCVMKKWKKLNEQRKNVSRRNEKQNFYFKTNEFVNEWSFAQPWQRPNINQH